MKEAVRLIGIVSAVGTLALATVGARQAPGADGELAGLLQRVGERVEEYFAQAQRIVCLEKVTWLPLGSGLGLDGMSREIESELSLAWAAPEDGVAAPEIKTVRKLLRVNGRPPRPRDPRNCTTPEQNETETAPLAMLLPGQRDEYRFKLRGTRPIDGRDALLLDFVEPGPVKVSSTLVDGNEDCISYTIDGGARGRIWIDAETYDVLRLDTHVPPMLDIPLPEKLLRRSGYATTALTLERADTTVEFEQVAFRDPDEVLLLPVSMVEMRETRGSGTRRLRTTTAYTDYRRFITGARIVK